MMLFHYPFKFNMSFMIWRIDDLRPAEMQDLPAAVLYQCFGCQTAALSVINCYNRNMTSKITVKGYK